MYTEAKGRKDGVLARSPVSKNHSVILDFNLSILVDRFNAKDPPIPLFINWRFDRVVGASDDAVRNIHTDFARGLEVSG
jgi:hypothetical protein